MNASFWIVAAAATLLVAGVAVELITRLVLRLWGAYYVWPPGLRLHLHPDREVFPELEPRARLEVNSDGERGGAVPDIGRRLYRILVAGGSPVECALLDQPTSWPGALERVLKSPKHLRVLGAWEVHVGNIGMSGVRSETLNLIFARVLPQYCHLNAIVIMVGGNDVAHWLANGAPPTIACRPIGPHELFSWHPRGPYGQSHFGWTHNQLAAVAVFRRLDSRWRRPLKVHTSSGKWVGNARAMRARAKEVRTCLPDPTPMLDFFERQFRELVRKAKHHADRVLVVQQPWFEKEEYTAEELAHLWHGAVGIPQREEVTAFYTIEIFNRLMAAVDRRTIQAANELGVEHLAVTPLLEPSLKNYYDSIHFTPAGAAKVAAAIASTLLPYRTLSGDGSPTPSSLTDWLPPDENLPIAAGPRTPSES